MRGLWGLALTQAVAPALIIWLLICVGLYLRFGNVEIGRAIFAGLVLFDVLAVVCRFDLENKRRAGAE